MNERIKELAEQASVSSLWMSGTDQQGNPILEKFAKLIVAECAEVAFKTDVSYTETDAMHRIRDRIKQHFGVAE
jgi:hypothetical protein